MQPIFGKAEMRLLWRILRLQGLAFQQQVQADDMAVQRKVQGREQMHHAPSVQTADKGAVPGDGRHPDGETEGNHRGLQGGHGSPGGLWFR